MNIDEFILVVTEDLTTIKPAHLGLLFYLCNQVTQSQKQQAPASLLDLYAILYAELLQRRVDVAGR